jgi:hypothetical protein
MFCVCKPDRRPRGLRGSFDLPWIVTGPRAAADAPVKAFFDARASRLRRRRLKSAMSKLLVVIAGVALAALVGCGGPAPLSASAACKDFTTWYGEQGGKILAGKDMERLRRAASEAPSGRLANDLHSLQLDIDSNRDFMETNSAPKDAIVGSDAAQVAADCKSVNAG